MLSRGYCPQTGDLQAAMMRMNPFVMVRSIGRLSLNHSVSDFTMQQLDHRSKDMNGRILHSQMRAEVKDS